MAKRSFIRVEEDGTEYAINADSIDYIEKLDHEYIIIHTFDQTFSIKMSMDEIMNILGWEWIMTKAKLTLDFLLIFGGYFGGIFVIAYFMRNDSEMKQLGIKPKDWWKIDGGLRKKRKGKDLEK